jgi:hypothetical protein
LVDLAVVDRDNGQWLPDVSHRGDRWIAGTPGHRYGVRLTNTSGQRVLVVLSVDGVNAVTGETAHPSQAGYVLEPWQSSEIAGWRKSYDDIAQFVFTDLHDSYAARTGRPDDVGVIGVAVFTEAPPIHSQHRAPPVASDRYESRRSAKSAAPAGECAALSLNDSHAAQGPALVMARANGRRCRERACAARGSGAGELAAYDDHATGHRGVSGAVRVIAMAIGLAFPRFVADPPPRW